MIAKYGKKPLFPKAFFKQIIADVYFVSNRNLDCAYWILSGIIADVYFVSNRNNHVFFAKKLEIIADVYFVSNRNARGIVVLP